jgi:hypothetical protein
MTASVSLPGRVIILIKGKLLFQYDGKNARGFDGKPEHKELRDLWENKYYKFKEDVMNQLTKMNPVGLWEMEKYPPNWAKRAIKTGDYVQKDEEGFKFTITNYDAFNDRLLILEDDASAFFDGWNIEVYEYGKEGLLVETIQTEIHSSVLLKACKQGFHRDWKHDAVCVKNIIQPKFPDEEAEEERKHDRAIKRHQDNAESGGEY